MKKTMLLLGLILTLACTQAPSSEVSQTTWLTDFEEATKEAEKRGVPILVDFSGSDWCGWCIKLDSEVFSKDEFIKYAKKNVVLFLADFPSKKAQSDKIKKQNKKLSEKYGVRGFPTVLLLDESGKELARTGYQRGGAAKYVKHLKELLERAD